MTGELLIEPPTLINLGFEWFIERDDNRERRGAGLLPQAGRGGLVARASAPAPPGRARLRGAAVRRRRSEHVRREHSRSGAGYGLRGAVRDDRSRWRDRRGHADRDRADAAGARPPRGREGCFTSTRMASRARSSNRPFEGLICALQLLVRRRGLRHGGGARGCGRGVHHPRARRALPVQPSRVRRSQPRVPVRGHLLPDGRRHARAADRHQGRRRRRGPSSTATATSRSSTSWRPTIRTSRGITFRNTEYAIWAGEQSIAWGRRGSPSSTAASRTSGSESSPATRGRATTTSPTTGSTAGTTRTASIGWSDAPLWGRFDGVDGQVHPPVMASYVAVKVYGPGHVVAHNYIADFHDGINVETYGNPDGSVASRTGSARRAPVPAPASTGTGVRSPSTSTTTTSPTPTTTRSRPTAACTTFGWLRNLFINHPSHAFCSQPVLGGPVYWIRNIAYNLPGGSEPLLRRRRGRLLQQHHPVGDHRDAVEHALAQQPDPGAERAGRLSAAASEPVRDHDVHQLHVVRLQRLRSRAGHAAGRSGGRARPST